MKRCSFNVAIAIKEAGYPQGITRDVYVIKADDWTYIDYPVGVCISSSVALPQDYIADIPYYMDVWLWLWREKKECIDIVSAHNNDSLVYINNELKGFNDPEEAIIAAIEYLVTNNLIK